MAMTWKNGRQLATLQDSDDTISYEYDSNSVRIKKTVDGVEHTYAYLGGKLMYETRGEAKFYYSYDANGYLYNVKYTLTDDSERKSYFFTHNSFGDIIGIYSGSGVLTAQYEYDAWGKVISITDGNGNEITDTNNIGLLNPFRYRGYYYDSDTGLYYLMSRYYDPVTRRFINADGYFQSGEDILDTNMSAYCANNPIMYGDPSGAITSKEILLDIVNNPNSKYSVKDATIAQKNEQKSYKYDKSYGNDTKYMNSESADYLYIETAPQVEHYYHELAYDDYEYYAEDIGNYFTIIGISSDTLEKYNAFTEIINGPKSGTVDAFGNQLYIEKGYRLITYTRTYVWDGHNITENQYILFNRQDECVFNKTVDIMFLSD